MSAYTMGNGYFKSAITQRTYPWQKDPDGSSKRTALRQLETDDLAATQLAEERAGRKLSLRELIQGVPPEDTRTTLERVQQDGKFISSPLRDPDANPYTKWLADLRKQVVRTEAEREARERRIEQATVCEAEWQEKRDAEKALEAQKAAAQSDLADAQANILLTVPEGPGTPCESALQGLRRHQAYYARHQGFAGVGRDSREAENCDLKPYSSMACVANA